MSRWRRALEESRLLGLMERVSKRARKKGAKMPLFWASLTENQTRSSSNHSPGQSHSKTKTESRPKQLAVR